MAPPRSIQGSIGSRIRVILGETGSSWLLLLDHDDGDSKWQSKNWKSIPNGLAKQINNCTAKERDVKYVDFGPYNSWYVYGKKKDGSGGHSWWGGLDSEQSYKMKETNPPDCKVALGGSQYFLPSLCVISGPNGYKTNNLHGDLLDRIKRTNNRGGTVHMIRLFSGGKYYIRDDQGTQWSTSSTHLGKELKKNQKEEDLAIAGDGSWIVIRPDGFVSSTGVDTGLTDQINTFIRQQRERKKKRQREIQEYHDRERAEREAREAAERERQEAAERAAREEEEAERRAEEERKRREEEERAKKAAEEESRATTLEVKLVEKLTQEKESIDKLETNLEAMQDHLSTMQDDLNSRKRSLRESLVTLPPAQRPRWNLGEDKPSAASSKRQENPQCVICQDKAPLRAVVPCGHVCLCDDCASSISQRPSYDRLCPLCRGPASSTLRIYT